MDTFKRICHSHFVLQRIPGKGGDEENFFHALIKVYVPL